MVFEAVSVGVDSSIPSLPWVKFALKRRPHVLEDEEARGLKHSSRKKSRTL
jgi:hypothetical protein